MKKLFNLLRGTILFDRSARTFVSVLDTKKRGKECDDLFYGDITRANFIKRTLTIEVTGENKFTSPEVTISFDDIVTLSRMKDGRLRMWIKVED